MILLLPPTTDTHPTLELAPGAEIAGCRIEGVAGRGGMGVVYRATQLDLDRPVAIKVITADRARDPGLRSRFGREARIVAQVAAGLDALHAAGLVHRDVKPANVLLAGEHVYLTDFGLSRLQASDARFTESGAWVGTVDYMSPEHLRGEPCDARSDVYALGCLLFAALTGTAPFRRETVPATMSAHLHEAPPRPSERAPVPLAFDGVVARALAKHPEDRFPSAGDLGRAALAAAAGEPVTEQERTVATGAAAPADPTAYTAVMERSTAHTAAVPPSTAHTAAVPPSTARGPSAPPWAGSTAR